MKLECTKKEWDFILNNICAYNNQTSYNYPNAKCIVYDDNEKPIILIDVTFAAEFVEDNE